MNDLRREILDIGNIGFEILFFWGFFFLSLIVTPFATLFFLFVCTPAKVPAKPKLSRSSKPRVKASV